MKKTITVIAVSVLAAYVFGACSSPLEGAGFRPGAPGRPELIAGSGRLAVRWDSVELAESYSLYYGENGNRPASPQITGVAGTSADIAGLVNNRTYCVWVQAVNRWAARLSVKPRRRPLCWARPRGRL